MIHIFLGYSFLRHDNLQSTSYNRSVKVVVFRGLKALRLPRQISNGGTDQPAAVSQPAPIYRGFLHTRQHCNEKKNSKLHYHGKNACHFGASPTDT